ncbi:hypothetical protein CDAR_198581 [Caerostris darwini]|uniref:Uncharacterized protein n=1 Tax=Caerostris darwini TaxID=1538125 RepID=A0AAV4W5I9_9ARAC|nr:hypothetical protein CDAR_198581 [Caerostris darwini]
MSRSLYVGRSGTTEVTRRYIGDTSGLQRSGSIKRGRIPRLRRNSEDSVSEGGPLKVARALLPYFRTQLPRDPNKMRKPAGPHFHAL